MPSNSLAIADSGARNPAGDCGLCAARPLSWRSGRYALGGAATLPDEKLPVKRRVSGIRGFHRCFSLCGMIRDRFRTSGGAMAVPGSRAEVLPRRPKPRGSRRSTTCGVRKLAEKSTVLASCRSGKAPFRLSLHALASADAARISLTRSCLEDIARRRDVIRSLPYRAHWEAAQWCRVVWGMTFPIAGNGKIAHHHDAIGRDAA